MSTVSLVLAMSVSDLAGGQKVRGVISSPIIAKINFEYRLNVMKLS